MKAEATRFAADLDRFVRADDKIGLAVSGGPDSVALLLLAHAIVPKRVAAATVDHGLRPDAAQEAEFVARLCDDRSIPHHTLRVDWPDGPPSSNIQAAARRMRYAALGDWAATNNLVAVATAHHRDDVVETLLMRLMRGSGVAGLAAMKAARLLSENVTLIRPLLDWQRGDLARIVTNAGITPVDDPSNADPAHDRARLRTALKDAGLGDLSGLAASAGHLRDVDRALFWTATRLADRRLRPTEKGWALVRGTIPPELLRRLMLIGFERLGDRAPRGPDLARAITALDEGGQAVLGKTLLAADGDLWTMEPAPPRRS